MATSRQTPQAYNLALAIVVLIVIFFQAIFNAFQDWSTQKVMNSILNLLLKMPSSSVTVNTSRSLLPTLSSVTSAFSLRVTRCPPTCESSRPLLTSSSIDPSLPASPRRSQEPSRLPSRTSSRLRTSPSWVPTSATVTPRCRRSHRLAHRHGSHQQAHQR